MASRNPSRPGPSGLTRTQQLRQAKSAALVKEFEKKEEISKTTEAPRRRRKLVAEPKKVDFQKPTMTKAMIARMKQAEKFKHEYEKKKEEEMTARRPKRTPAPIGGDARMGRERVPRKRTPSPPPRVPLPKAPEPPRPPRRLPRPAKKPPDIAIPEKTQELARSMNAEIIQAQPVGEGPIDSIVIPPGAVSDNRTTIVSIPQPPAVGIEATATSQIANRSIQVISETLDEQEAVEAAAVQSKLVELQQARREFVIAVANVGGNAVSIGEEPGEASPSPPPALPCPPPQSPPRRIYKIPDIDDEMFHIEYGRDHPNVIAAREFAQRSMAALRDREAARRMDEEFARIARQPVSYDLQIDVPFEDEFMEADLSWEEDEETGMDLPCPSRIKASMLGIPAQEEPYQYQGFDPEELERFFDVQRYPPPPPCPGMRGPPTGREDLHPDLWELDDPWCKPCQQADMPDLIDFESY